MKNNGVIVEAWSKAVKPTLAQRQKAVLTALQGLGGKATSKEVARFLKVERDSVSPRFAELIRMNMIEVAGIKRDENMRRGMTVYRLISNIDLSLKTESRN